MFIRLLEPKVSNWMLQAEGLADPAGWTRFLPSHSTDSERARFERTVKDLDLSVGLVLRKNLLQAGLCVFEYDWNVSEDRVLEHAMRVAEILQVELVLGNQPTPQAA